MDAKRVDVILKFTLKLDSGYDLDRYDIEHLLRTLLGYDLERHIRAKAEDVCIYDSLKAFLDDNLMDGLASV